MKRSITLKSLLIIFLCNAAIIAVYFFLLRHVYLGVERWTEPFPALDNLNKFLHKSERLALPVLFGAGAGFSVISWFLVSLLGNKVIGQCGDSVRTVYADPPKESKKEKKGALAELDSAQPSERASLQMLIILQRHGRLVDFLQEDLGQFEDAQIGAAVRNIHADCKGTLNEHVRLEHVFKDEEGQEVTVQQGFDTQAIQLTGNVKGDPPFKGVLRHRGWRATKVKMPKLTAEGEKNNIIAPAEVEIA